MRKSGDLIRCKKSADEFLTVARYCREKQKESKFELIRPLFVNASLACELYMKTIYMIESPDSTYDAIHELKILFGKLSIEARIQIENIYNKKFNRMSLSAFLEKYNNNFVKWRYSFEGEAYGHPVAMIVFAESLQEYIRRLDNGKNG